MRNWKTTSAGVANILTALGDIVHAIATGQPINYAVDMPMIITGVGLLSAKDASTSSTPAEVVAAGEKEAEKEAKP